MPRVPKPTCCVCFEKFNKTSHTPTTCPHCQIQICRTCFQTYLLGDTSDVPRCVNVECDRGWERNFLDAEFTTTFRLKTYKEHREKILADREKSRLPTAQEDAAAFRNAREAKADAEAKLEAVREESRRITRELDKAYRDCHYIERTIETYGRERIPDPVAAASGTPAPVKKQVVAFVKPCPADGCKGFLSTAWKCGLCDLYTCPDCHDLKGAVRDDPNHRCDAEKVATATLLNREARACPKCGVSICKIEGCDQMWCTQCNTGFNWRTGKMAEGPVHNPHYFEWLRSQGREITDPANALPQGPNACALNQDREISRAIYGNEYGAINLYGHYRRQQINRTQVYLGEAWRLAREAEDMARVETADTEEKLRVFRVKYMIGELNETDWKAALQRSEKDMRFRVAKAQVLQVFAAGVLEIIRQVLTSDHDKEAIRKQIDDLVKYCNGCYESTQKQFGRKIKPIDIEALLPAERQQTVPTPAPGTAT